MKLKLDSFEELIIPFKSMIGFFKCQTMKHQYFQKGVVPVSDRYRYAPNMARYVLVMENKYPNIYLSIYIIFYFRIRPGRQDYGTDIPEYVSDTYSRVQNIILKIFKWS